MNSKKEQLDRFFFKKYLNLIKIFCIVFGILFFGNSYNAEAAVRTWTGTTSGLWSVASNWGGTVPVTGDDLVFPSGASNLSNTNDLTPNTIFNSITLSGSGYTLSGNSIILGQGLAGITDSASSGGNVIAFDIRLDNASPVLRDITVTNTAEILTISGRIAGVGGIAKEGTGTLILSGGNTFGGILKINVGVVSARHSTALGTIVSGTEVVGGAALELQGNINISYEPLALRGYGVLNAGALRNISGTNTYAGLITLSSAGGTEISSDSGTLNLEGGITAGVPLVFDGAGNITFSKTPITGAGIITKNGSGTITFNFPNTYTGATTINAGTLAYGTDNAISSGAITITGGTLDIGSYSDIVGAITLGTLDLANGTITGTTGMLSSSSWTVYQGTISAIIGGYRGTLTKSTLGTVILTRANEYTGATTINAGILEIQNNYSLGFIDGITTVTAGATLQINGSGLSIPEYVTFSGTGHLYTGAIRNKTGNNTLTGLLTNGAVGMIMSDTGTTLTIDGKGLSATTQALTVGGAGDVTFTSTAPIYGTTATLTKNDTGILTISSFSNFTGVTTINKGELILNNLGAIPLSTITVNSGGTLTLDNSTTVVKDRISDAATLTLNGGNFNFKGSSSAGIFESAGVLTVGVVALSGDNKITITPGSGGSTIMRFASLTRTAGASILFRGTSLGSTPGAGVSNLLFSTAPTLLGDDGSPNTPTLSVIQGAFGDNSLTGTGTDMVTYSQGNIYGLRLLNGAGFSGEYTTDLSITNANIKLTSSTPAITSQINSLILNSSASITNPSSAQNITLVSGNILNTVTSATLAGSNTTFTMSGNIEGIIRNTSDLSLSAIVTTTGGLTKTGSGILTINSSQTYTGLTSVNEGTFLAGLSNFISSGNVTVNGGTLDLSTFNDTVGTVILQNGTIASSTGVLTGASYSVREGTVSASLGGAVTLTKVTTNTAVNSIVTLSGENSYTGATTISGGIIKIGGSGNGTNSPLGTVAGATTVANIAALDLNGFTLSTNEPVSIAGLGFGPASSVATGNSNMGALMNSSATSVSYSGAITLTAAARINADYGTLTISSNIAGNFPLTFAGLSDITYSGVRSGTSTIVKEGNGTLTLSNGNSSYSGVTTISVGTVKIGAASVGGTNSPLGTAVAVTTVALGARLDLNGINLGIAEPLTLNGVGYGLGDFASGALMNSSGTSVTYSGLLTLGSASTIKSDFGNIDLTNAGTVSGAFLLTVGGDSNGTISSIIGNVGGGIIKIGTGTWTLSGQNTYTGATNINLGTLKLGANGGATNSPLGTTAGATTVSTGAVLDFNTFTMSTAEVLSINGRGINDGGALIGSNGAFSGAITQGTDSRITNPSGTMTFTTQIGAAAFNLYIAGSGNITANIAFAASALSITKQGSGTFTVSGANLYTGYTRVDEGTFIYAATTTLAATNLIMNGGTFNNGVNADAIGTITLVGGTITNTVALTGTAYTFEKGTVSGILSGGVGIVKNTNNTVTLSGVNTISNTVTINAGELLISGSGSATSATTLTINLGGTLTLDNSTTAVASRLPDAVALTMNGGSFNFIGNPAAASSETIGALTLATGHNTITVTPGAGGSTTLTSASLSRTAGATALFRGTSFGSAPAANISTLVFTAAPTLTGAAGAANSNTISVIKGAFGDSSLSGTGSDMVTYNVGNTNGLRLLNGAGFSGEYATNLATANANVKLSADTAATTTNTNSVILNGFNITNPGGATTLPIASASLSGNILINSSTNIAGANTTLGITTFELPILATANSTISAIIGTATTGSLTLSGSGNITLSANNLFTGATNINNATLTYGANNVISSGAVNVTGGILNLNNNSDTIGALTLRAGTVNTGSGTLTLGGNLTTVANANFTSLVTGNLGLGGNRVFDIGDGLMDNDAIISAVISGAFTITKSTGAGILVLSGDNSYTGSTTVSAGILRLGAGGGVTNTPLGTTGAGTIISGVTSALDLNGFTLGTSEALTLSGALAVGALQNTSSNAVSYSGLITLGAASTIISNYGDINITNTGTISGATFGLTIGGSGNGTLSSIVGNTTGGITKNGFGLWILSGNSTYTGATTISSGTLKLGAAGSGVNTPLGTTGGSTTVSTGAILDLNGFTLATSEALTISGTGIASIGAFINSSNNSISYNGAITLAAAASIVNYGNGVLTLTGNISGNFAATFVTIGGITQSSTSVRSGTSTIVKEGSGTLILAGQNSFVGAVTINGGILQLGANGGATNTPLGTIAGGVSVANGAVIDLSTFVVGGASTWEPLTLNGSGIKNGGALISTASSNNSFGATSISSNSLVKNLGSGTLIFAGTISAGNGINLNIAGSGPTTFTGAYGAGGTTATLTKWDSGTLTANVISPVTGLYRINGGTFAYGVADTIGTSPLTIAGGTLDLKGFNETNIGALTLIDGAIINTGGAATLTSTTNYTVENGTISAVLGGAAIGLNKNTGGTVTLSGVNTFAGLTTISAGTLSWGINDALSTGALTIVGGIADLNTRTDTVAAVTLTNGTITSSTGILTGTSYAVSSGTISVILSGAVNLTKSTTGTVFLSGLNTYTGITTISGGILSVNNLSNGGVASAIGQSTNAASNLVFNTGTATLQYTGDSVSTDRAYTTTAALTTQFDILNPSTVLTWSGSGTATTAPFTKLGLGTLKFNATQGHTGTTTVNEGTLQYGIADMLSTGAVTVSKGILDLNNFSDSVGVVTLQNRGQIIDSGGSSATLTTTGTAALQSGTISAILGGSTSPSINKTTSGRVILSGNNTFTGGSVLFSAGYLKLSSDNALGNSGSGLNLTVSLGATLELENNIILPSTKVIIISGSGINNLGAIRNVSGNNTISANVTLGSTNTLIVSDNGILGLNNISGNTFNTLFGGAGDINVTGAITTTTGNVTKNGAGTLTLSGVNTYSGTTTINAGVLGADSTSTLGDGSVTNTLIFNGGSLKANGTITSPVNRAVTLTQTGAIDTNGNNVSIAGTVGSVGGLTKNGTGTLTLTGATTLGGDLTIANGTFVAPTSLTLNRDLINNGTFTHSNGTVTLVPTSPTLTTNILGSSNTTFYNLTNITPSSTLKFKASNTYTIANSLTLSGSLNNLLSLSSDTPGVQWLMTLSGSSTLSYIGVKDSGCSGGNNVNMNSTIFNNGNNGICWFFANLSGGSVGNIESSATPDPDQGGGGQGGGGGTEGSGGGGSNGGGGQGGGGGDTG